MLLNRLETALMNNPIRAAIQRRANDLRHMLRPRRAEQQQLGRTRERLFRMQQVAANRFGQGRSAGFARRYHLAPARLQPRTQQLELRRLAATIDSFKA